jgi:hypothetical protein
MMDGNEDLDGCDIADDDDDMINQNDYQTERGDLSFKECVEKLRKAANPRADYDKPDEQEEGHRLRP